jgi:hypothetical protein
MALKKSVVILCQGFFFRLRQGLNGLLLKRRNRPLTCMDFCFQFAQEYGWQLEAWAVFANHYHTVPAGNLIHGISANFSSICTGCRRTI